VILSELVTADTNFAKAVKMLVIKAQNDGLSTLPMQDLINNLNRMGFSATNQVNGIRGLIATFKGKNPNLVADVNNDQVILTKTPSADTEKQAQQNKEKVGKDAVKQARKDLGL